MRDLIRSNHRVQPVGLADKALIHAFKIKARAMGRLREVLALIPTFGATPK